MTNYELKPGETWYLPDAPVSHVYHIAELKDGGQTVALGGRDEVPENFFGDYPVARIIEQLKQYNAVPMIPARKHVST